MNFIRKRLKDETYEDFSVEDLLSILEGSDLSIYYSKKGNESIEQVLGIEIRFIENIYIDSEKTIINLIRELGSLEKKDLIFKDERR